MMPWYSCVLARVTPGEVVYLQCVCVCMCVLSFMTNTHSFMEANDNSSLFKKLRTWTKSKYDGMNMSVPFIRSPW